MATLHLIHGFVGAGKTTFSKRLENELNAIRFTPDEWMVALYSSNAPAEDFEQLEERIKGLIWKLTERALQLGIDVILDFGFWKRGDRDQARERGRRLNVSLKLYDVQCPEEDITARVLKRTEQMPEGALYIDENAIEEFKRRFEPLDRNWEDSILVTSVQSAENATQGKGPFSATDLLITSTTGTSISIATANTQKQSK